MQGSLKSIRSSPLTPMTLIVVALAACVPANSPTPTPPPHLLPTENATSTPRLLPTENVTPTPPLSPTAPPTSTQMLDVPTPIVMPTSIPDVTIYRIKMMDGTTGWAEGRVGDAQVTSILRTMDGGETWREVTPRLLKRGDWDAFFLDEQFAWAWIGNEGEAWRTEDGGQSWRAVASHGWAAKVWFSDDQNGWKMEATVSGMVFVSFDIELFATTQDGGQTWEELEPPPGGGGASMAYLDERRAWVIRAAFAQTFTDLPNMSVPFFVKTTSDGGQTWISYSMPFPPGAYSTVGFDGNSYLGGTGNCDIRSPLYSSLAIWKFALICYEGDWLYTTANQGKTWIISPLPAGGKVLDIEFANPSVGWFLRRDLLDFSQSRLYQTSNGGQSWSLLKSTGWPGAELHFLDENTGWALVCATEYCYPADSNDELVTTMDGGQTWQTLDPHLAP